MYIYIYMCIYIYIYAPKFKMQMPNILLLTRIGSLPKKKRNEATRLKFCHARESWFPILCHNSSDTICYKNNNFEFPKGFPTFWAKKKNYYSLLLFTCHYSPVTIHRYYSPLLFTPKFCLFKGGCPLYLRQVFFMLSSGLLP